MGVLMITGASSGLGRALALRFASQGKTVCALARSSDKLQQLAAQYPENLYPYPTDISDSEQVKKNTSEIEKRHGPVEVLINNASIHMNSNFVDVDFEYIDKIIDIDLKGMLYCTRAVLHSMIDNKSGHIINISSVGGLRGAPRRSLYIAAKHGMVGFGDALAQELLPHGILVVTLCPGGIATPLWDENKNPYPGDSAKLVKPEEIADLIEFILKQPKHILYKKLVFFPTVEWHSV